MDDWALVDEVNITDHIPVHFFETIRSTKWTERRDMVQTLIDILSAHPRLDPTIKYNEIITELKLIILKDSNVVVVALAIRALTAFVKGLRKNFAKYIPMILLQILEKFKEKKATVKEAIVECLEFVAEHCDNAVLVGPICEALEKSTNPSVKANIDHWIYCILCHYPRNTAPIAFIKSIGPYLVKHSNDGDADVREGSYMALGAILRLIDEKATISIADGVFCDKAKAKKIMEYSEKATKDFDVYEQTRIKLGITVEEPCASGENKENDAALDGGVDQSNVSIDPWELLTETTITDKIPCDMKTMLASKQWKERKEMLETLCDILEKNPRLCPDEDHSEIIGILRKLLEKDVNINVATAAAKCILGFANGLRYGFAKYLPKVYGSVFEKFKEKKAVLREPLIELCDALARLAPLPTYVEVVEVALQKPNPQIKTQTALFVSRLLCQHNAQTLPLNCVMQRIGPALIKLSHDADPDSRDAAFVATGAIMRITGENGVNICCAEIMQDENKATKVREHCERLKKEFGLNASAPILNLHNKTRSAEVTIKSENDKAHSAAAGKKDLKDKVEVTKRTPQGSVVTKSKAYKVIQKQRIVPVVRSHSMHSANSTASAKNLLSVGSKYNQAMKILPAKKEHELSENMGTVRGAEINSEKRSSSDKDEFFDAAEEFEAVSLNSGAFDTSSDKNRTFIVGKNESEATEIPTSSRSVTKRPSSASSTVSSVPIYGSRIPRRIPRSMSGSRIPIPVYQSMSGSRIPAPVSRRT